MLVYVGDMFAKAARGRVRVSPTAEPTGATASPVASPTDSPSPSGSCAEGGVCQLGDLGPGGGVVFYVASSSFTCGPDMALSCNYLEVAPNLWAPNSQSDCGKTKGGACGGSSNGQTTSDFSGTGKGITWCTGTGSGLASGVRNTAIGMGYANTTAMVGVCNSYDAGKAARLYNGGGLNDWSLGSQDEMNALFMYPDRAAIGGFNSGYYWTSTPTTGNKTNKKNPVLAWTQDFQSNSAGYGASQGMTATEGVRPLRAF